MNLLLWYWIAEVKELLSVVLRDLQFHSAVVIQVCVLDRLLIDGACHWTGVSCTHLCLGTNVSRFEEDSFVL